MTDSFDIVVAGGGLAGLSAAFQAAIRGMEVACIQPGGLYGGLLMNVGSVDDMPGLAGMPGAAVAQAMIAMGRDAGVKFIEDRVLSISGPAGRMQVACEAGTHAARRVIAATGARLRSLDVPGARELAGRGVSDCAWCDGGLYRNQRVAVVGAGDSAMQAALHLVNFCAQVDVLVRGESIRARQSYVSAVADNPKVAFHWAATILAIEGSDAVTGVTLRDSDGQTETLPCTGIFVYAGLVPEADALPETVQRDADGAVLVNGHLETSHPGLFAAG